MKEKRIAGTKPVCEKVSGWISWCSCGYSKKQPFCDGAHRDTEPGLVSVKTNFEEEKEVWFCMCKQTKDPNGFCDGSHNNL